MLVRGCGGPVLRGGVTAMKSKSSFLLMAATAVGLANASPAMADLIGTSVSGNLDFGGQGINFFDPANGFIPVPPGFGNSVPHGPNNVIIGSEIEFGFAESNVNTDTADFTGIQVTITNVSAAGNQTDAHFTFTDTAFSGAAISL